MKITNKYSKNRISKKNKFTNWYMNILKKFRLSIKKIFPLSKYEELLYRNPSRIEKVSSKFDRGKYIEINCIIILNLVSKVNCDNLYDGIMNLYGDNPLIGYLGGEIQLDRLRKCITSFSISASTEHWAVLSRISPKDTGLYKIADYVEIDIFDFSSDYIGIAFKLELTAKYKKDLKEAMTCTIEGKQSYERYNYKKQKRISLMTESAELARKDAVEDLLLEVKYYFHNLFKKYLPLELDYKNEAPISLDIYKTNYDLKNDNSSFFKSLDLFSPHFLQEYKDAKLCYRNTGKNDSFNSTKMWYELKIDYRDINRANQLYYFVENEDQEIITFNSGYINFYLLTIGFYRLEDMLKEITIERNKLYSCKPSKTIKINKQYELTNANFQRYNMTFKGVKYYSFSDYRDEYLERGIKNLKEMFEKQKNQYNEINNEYSIRMNINNSRTAFYFAVISIIVAILALVLTIFFEYRNANNIKSNPKVSQANISAEENHLKKHSFTNG